MILPNRPLVEQVLWRFQLDAQPHWWHPNLELQFVNAPLSGPQYEPDAAVVFASPMVYPAAQAAPAQARAARLQDPAHHTGGIRALLGLRDHNVTTLLGQYCVE
jgi:hypothetical protein